MSLDLKDLLPQDTLSERRVIEKITQINTQIKDDLTSQEIILITSLRMASSETNAEDKWKRALLLSQEYLNETYLSNQLIKEINFQLTGNIGYRKVRVTVDDTEFPSADEIAVLMDEFQTHFKNISNPISRAAYIYQSISSIHPFQDGNGRTGRLVADHTLISNSCAPLIFPVPTLAFVVPAASDKSPHLMALNRILESTEWMKSLLS